MTGIKKKTTRSKMDAQSSCSHASDAVQTKKRKEKRSDEDSTKEAKKKKQLSERQHDEFPMLRKPEEPRREHSKKHHERKQHPRHDSDESDDFLEYDTDPTTTSSDEEPLSVLMQRNNRPQQTGLTKWTTKPVTGTKVSTESDHTEIHRNPEGGTTAESKDITRIREASEKLYKGIMHTLLDKRNEIDPEAFKEVFVKLSELKDLVQESLIQNSNLVGQLSALKQETTGTKYVRSNTETPSAKSRTGNTMTYAERLGLKSKAASLATRKQDPPNLVKITPEDTEQYSSSEKTKEKVKELITPVETNLRVRNLRRIQGNGILVETENKENVEALLASEKLKRAGLNVGLPQKKNPRIIIFDVPEMESDDKIIQAIIDQNTNEEEGKKLRREMKIAFKTGVKDKQSNNVIIDVSKNARDIIIKKDRIYVGWNCCKVQDYLAVTRCYKCQGFGHTTKYCRSSNETCGHCSESNHSFKNCPNKAKPAVCSNCKKQGRSSDHCVTSKECPAYSSALNQLILRTDYGI